MSIKNASGRQSVAVHDAIWEHRLPDFSGKVVSDAASSKAERQDAFRAACKKEGLSNAQAVRKASFIPKLPKEEYKVLCWPKL